MIAVPVRLTAAHATDGFRCGHRALDHWLAHQALRADEAGTAVTYVVTDARVVGYYSLSGHSIQRGAVGGGWLARNTPDPIPAILLGRLAVDTAYQGQGLGWSLLQHAIVQARTAGALVGVRALVVDPIDEAAADFYRHFGFRPFPANPARQFIPLC
jgi:GNAT superfamily N-acetyltransferase